MSDAIPDPIQHVGGGAPTPTPSAAPFTTHEPPDQLDGRVWDVVVVGGGSAGLSAALSLARVRRSVLVIDDGRPRNAPAVNVGAHGILGRDGISPPGAVADRARRGRRIWRHRGLRACGAGTARRRGLHGPDGGRAAGECPTPARDDRTGR
ncbi:FAD-dependent oxidoreductase [Solicola gregarius]|uniref:FAD-dependent oxidoreductase n=1 Tax=Solicola gregarius TaxID=2908642 RepID=UPI002304DAD8|nr:FAD-dependent oxidoreductase [Solicola gregarius]